MIEIKNLKKNYEQKKLFDNYTTGFEGPGLYFITGKSGSGTTTLLNIIGGLEPYDGGEVIIDNRRVRKNNNRELWKNVTFVFPDDSLVEDQTVDYNLSVGLKKKADNRDRIAALKEVGLTEGILKRQASSLTGTEKRRVAIARSILRDTKYIFADEPTAELDKDGTKKIMELFKDLSNNKIIIIATHDQSILKYGKGRVEL